MVLLNIYIQLKIVFILTVSSSLWESPTRGYIASQTGSQEVHLVPKSEVYKKIRKGKVLQRNTNVALPKCKKVYLSSTPLGAHYAALYPTILQRKIKDESASHKHILLLLQKGCPQFRKGENQKGGLYVFTISSFVKLPQSGRLLSSLVPWCLAGQHSKADSSFSQFKLKVTVL